MTSGDEHGTHDLSLSPPPIVNRVHNVLNRDREGKETILQYLHQVFKANYPTQ